MTTDSKKDTSPTDLPAIIEQQQEEIFRLKNIIDELPGSIYWKDLNGRYLGVNKYGLENARKYKLNPDNYLGKTDYDYFQKDVADSYRQNDLIVMNDGKEISVEEPTRTNEDGKKYIQFSTKKPLRDSKGNIIGIIGNTIDITEIKFFQAELEVAKVKAEAANKAKTEFIRNMEHDIRTPFNGILAMANILREREQDKTKKEYLDDIIYSAEELLEYCNVILDFSKLEHEKIPLLSESLSVMQLLEVIQKMETPAAKTKGIMLDFRIDKDVPAQLIGDQHRLKQILINLVSNAIKFTDSGSISISINIIEKLNQNKLMLNFCIEDTGIGIPENKLDTIFDKFTRVSPSSTGIYKGTGLGLWIVKTLLEEMSGNIEVESVLGKGSKFTFTLPMLMEES